MTRPASEILEDLLAVALRIERILTREADNATVDYWIEKLRQPVRHGVPVRPGVVQHIPGMPDPPLPRVQTTWKTPPGSYMHGEWIHR